MVLVKIFFFLWRSLNNDNVWKLERIGRGNVELLYLLGLEKLSWMKHKYRFSSKKSLRRAAGTFKYSQTFRLLFYVMDKVCFLNIEMHKSYFFTFGMNSGLQVCLPGPAPHPPKLLLGPPSPSTYVMDDPQWSRESENRYDRVCKWVFPFPKCIFYFPTPVPPTKGSFTFYVDKQGVGA